MEWKVLVYPVETVGRNVLQHDGFHGLHIGKPGFWYKQSTHNMAPAWKQEKNQH